jgi:hypothetical protein
MAGHALLLVCSKVSWLKLMAKAEHFASNGAMHAIGTDNQGSMKLLTRHCRYINTPVTKINTCNLFSC